MQRRHPLIDWQCEANPNDKLGVCLTCQRVSSGLVWRLPCLRYKITDVKLFKPGQVKGYEWTRRWMEGVADDISKWASSETKYIKLTEGYIKDTVDLRVRKFVPQDGDSLERSWVAGGIRKRVKIPAYAIVNLEEAKGVYSNYISHNMAEFCRNALSGKDRLLIGTYSMVIRIVRDPKADEKEKEALRKALHLWMAVRMTTRSTFIVGEETLGMTHDIMDESSPLNGKIPLPPVMGAQIELVLIHQIQSTLRREILDHLQTMTHANKQQTWFVTYLITFILLHNVALLCQHDEGYAKKHGMKVSVRCWASLDVSDSNNAEGDVANKFALGRLASPERTWFGNIRPVSRLGILATQTEWLTSSRREYPVSIFPLLQQRYVCVVAGGSETAQCLGKTDCRQESSHSP